MVPVPSLAAPVWPRGPDPERSRSLFILRLGDDFLEAGFVANRVQVGVFFQPDKPAWQGSQAFWPSSRALSQARGSAATRVFQQYRPALPFL